MDDKTFTALQALAAKLNTTAEHIWRILTQAMPLEGVVSLALVGTFLALLAGVGAYSASRFFVEGKSEDYRTRDRAPFWLFPAFICSFTFFICIATSNLEGQIMKIVAPEHAALKYLLNLVK